MLVYIILTFMGTKGTKVTIDSVDISKEPQVGYYKVDLDDLVSKISKRYKQSTGFQECIGFDTGVKTCLREAINSKIRETEDVKYCADFIQENEKDACVISYANRKALETEDIKYCADLMEGKESCEEAVVISKAKSMGDIAICEDVNDIFKKQLCREQIVTKKAKESLKESDCEVLSEPSLCKNEVRFEKEQKLFLKEMAIQQEEDRKRLEQ